MAHSGLFVDPVPGTPPVGTAAVDGRLVLGGVFQVADQLIAGGGYTPSASVMQLTVNQAVWSIHDVTNASAVFFSPTDAATLTFSAAPATGGRIALVVVKQNNYANADADSRVNLSVVTGTPSGSPTAPAVPSGAGKYLAVLINAGVTNIAAATITNYMQTAYADPPLQAPTLAALQATTGMLSQIGIVTADTAANNGMYVWMGSPATWIPNGANPHFVYQKTAAYTWGTSATTMNWDSTLADGTLAGFTNLAGVFTCTIPGVYNISTDVTVQATAASQQLVASITKNGSALTFIWGQSSTTNPTSVVGSASIRFAIGDTFQITVKAGASSAGYVNFTSNILAVDFLHA